MKSIFFVIKIILNYPKNLFRGNKIHITSRISTNSKLVKCVVGKYCYIANNVNLINTEVGNYCSIAPSVQIGGMEHSYWWLSTSSFLSTENVFNRKTKIGHDVWIAAGSIIKQGIEIGDGAVVGALSFVNKDVPPYSIVVGSPAIILKFRFSDAKIRELRNSKYWFFKPSIAKRILDSVQ